MPKIVNAKTKLFAILGDPIEHCLSPVIMNYSFAQLGLDNVFVAMRCPKDRVDLVMRALAEIDLAGYVITMPLKELVAPYLDESRGAAKTCGAVNCIQNLSGRLIGHNTDSIGFWSAVQEKKPSTQAVEKVFILGMGGLGKAVAAQAALEGVKNIVAVNRDGEPLLVQGFENLSRRLCATYSGLNITTLPWEPEKWLPHLADTDLAINVTPNGLDGKGSLHLDFPYDSVPQRAIFFDALLSTGLTAFLQEAEKRGHTVIDGVDLLAHQGVEALRIFTGQTIGYEDMGRAARAFLAQD